MIFSWIKTRKLYVILSLLDFISIIVSYFIINFQNDTFSEFYKNKNLINILFTSIIWSNFSYIIGRYNIKKNIYFTKKFKTITREIIIILVLSYISILLIENSFDLLFDQIFYKLIIVSTLCSGIQFFSNYFYKKFLKEKKKTIWFLGKQETIDKILFYVNNISIKKNFNIRKFDKNLLSTPDEIIISDIQFIEQYKKSLNKLTKLQIPILTISQWCESNLNLIPSEFLEGMEPYSSIHSKYKGIGRRRIKRMADIIVSIMILIFSSPLIFFSAIIIKLQDKGPIFYKQKRTGLWGEEIIILKLRTMIKNAEEKGVKWSVKNDSRITPFGEILRKTRLDEIPQLFLVIKGDMSLIGPRPERPEFDKDLDLSIKNYGIRYWVQPGLSGWAQVNYPYGASKKDAIIKLSYDLFYLNNISLFLDLQILFKTIILIIKAKGSEPNS